MCHSAGNKLGKAALLEFFSSLFTTFSTLPTSVPFVFIRFEIVISLEIQIKIQVCP
jgi:hypothetical protein